MPAKIKYFDVTYRTPSGELGEHRAVKAETKWDAAKLSACMLCYGTNYTPEQFTVLKVRSSLHKPKEARRLWLGSVLTFLRSTAAMK
jgi:hypothetical protein